ncbi:hypothetical protein JT358_04595 [Micrococcales bacterium 31B]|nr:hypothetical protein [Micrococcales bacterium 31B]
MKTLLIGTLRFQRGRLFAASTAVILAVAFVVATLMLHAAYLGAAMNNLVNDVSKADVIVSPATSAVEDALGDQQTREYLDAVEKAPGVTASFEVYRSFAMTGEDSANAWQLYAFDVMPTTPEAFRGATLERGTWPTGTDVALSESVAHTRGLDVGDSLSYVVTLPSASGDGIEKPVTGKVSGIVPVPATPTPAMNYVSPELFATLSHSALPEQVLLRADDPDAVVSSLRALAASQGHQISGNQSVPAPGVTQVSTRADYLDGMLKASTGEAQVMLSVDLGGSVLGVLAGCALAYAVIGASWLGSVVSLAVVPPSWEAAGLGLAVGTVMALVAGLRPQALATRISPLSVMRATDEVVADAHPAKARAAGAILLVAGGLTLLWLGSRGGQGLAFALPGGATTFLGLLLALPFGVPPLLRGMTRCLHRFPTLALAGANAGRNPRRVTMTVTAMMVAVTLVSMFIVGAASMKESMIREIEARNPVDVIVDQARLDDQTVRAVAALDGVRTSATLRGVAVYPVGNVPPASPEVTAAQSENDAVTSASYGTGGLLLAAGAPPALASVNRSDEAFAPADHTL